MTEKLLNKPISLCIRYPKVKYFKAQKKEVEKWILEGKLRKINSGITLISLIVTIIILLILAGVTLNLSFGEAGILNNTLHAKFATEVRQIEEEVMLKQVMSDSSYTGTINDLLGTDSDYNNKLIIQEGNLVYVASEVSSQETKWLESLGIEEASDYYTVEFDSAGGNEIKSQIIKAGEQVNMFCCKWIYRK